jgi:cell division protein FtsQ
MAHALPAPVDVRLMNATASVLFLACGALVLAALAWWALRHPAFAVRALLVEGELAHNNAVTLRAQVAHRLHGNFFTLDLAQARAAFESVPWVREATVRREFPNRVRVALKEHEPAALWGPEDAGMLLNTHGERFAAGVDDAEAERLPRLRGPDARAAEVLAMHRALSPLLAPLDMAVAELELSGRGGWRAVLEPGGVLQLGSGTPADVVPRVQRFVRTLAAATSHSGRRPDRFEAADLRHQDGYALKLPGVTTLADPAATPPKPPKPAKPTNR